MVATKYTSRQRGDTLIEVLIAITILSVVIVSSYSLANRSLRLGQSAKERTQATQYLQEQAEGLRALRDSSWTTFKVAIDTASPVFHVEEIAGVWDVQNGDTVKDGRYTIRIQRISSTSDQIEVNIGITWERIGGGVDTTNAYLKLVRVE